MLLLLQLSDKTKILQQIQIVLLKVHTQNCVGVDVGSVSVGIWFAVAVVFFGFFS